MSALHAHGIAHSVAAHTRSGSQCLANQFATSRALLGAAAHPVQRRSGAIRFALARWNLPHFRPAFTPMHLAQVAVLALLANLCYSAVYLLDLVMQWSGISGEQRMLRWTLWAAGLLLAIVLENYWIADEIYPFVS
jgi:hypothetical protein